MSRSSVLVTGGAGFIGSHVARLASERGRTVIVLDDLSGGVGEGLPRSVRVVEGDIGDTSLVRRIVRAHEVGSVVHAAGKSGVRASLREPERYFDVNVVRSLRLLDTVRELGVRAFVFASTAAVYGQPELVPVPELAPLAPITPWGSSKLAFEYALSAAGPAHGLAWGALRHVEVAGARFDGSLAEHHDPATHLIPLALDAALGDHPPLVVAGTDHPTPDGTYVRDYVHIEDLAEAYLRALDAVEMGASIGAINVGTGRGHSVREVIAAVASVVGRPVPHSFGPRQPGDAAQLVADPHRARVLLGWRARRLSLPVLIADTLRARLRRPRHVHVSEPAWDSVDEASWESFPASDPPAHP